MSASRRLAPIIAGALVCSACSDDGAAPACARQAIYYGAPSPDGIALSAAQLASFVRVRAAADGQDFCTGLRLAPEWVVTAAHCDLPAGLTVTLGTDASQPLASAAVAEFVAHPSLDIALLRLEEAPAVPFEPLPIWGGDASTAWVGVPAELAGFGKREDGEVGDLRFVSEVVSAVGSDTISVDGQGRSGACAGDSGGPLLMSTSAGPAAIGVLSTGAISCVGVDVYVRLGPVLDWLTSVAGALPTAGAENARECP